MNRMLKEDKLNAMYFADFGDEQLVVKKGAVAPKAANTAKTGLNVSFTPAGPSF